MPSETLLERFWGKVNRRESDECWDWMAAKSSGYGIFWDAEKVQKVRAHRYVYELMVAPIPEGTHIPPVYKMTEHGKQQLEPDGPRDGRDTGAGQRGTGRPGHRADGRPDLRQGGREPWVVGELGPTKPEDAHDLEYKVKNREGEDVPVLLFPIFSVECDPVEPE